jgi:hypothetical protein
VSEGFSASNEGGGSAHRVDPELVRRFSLFRDAQPADSVPLDERDLSAIQRFVSGGGGDRFGLSADDAKKVVVNQAVTVLVVPGKDGVSVMMLEPGAGFSAFWAPSESVVAGHPVGSVGATVIGLAPDGVAAQPVVLAGDTTVSADVVQNVYAIEDPARAT